EPAEGAHREGRSARAFRAAAPGSAARGNPRPSEDARLIAPERIEDIAIFVRMALEKADLALHFIEDRELPIGPAHAGELRAHRHVIILPPFLRRQNDAADEAVAGSGRRLAIRR